MSDSADDEGNIETAVAGGEDRIGALPDDVLRYLMSFLLSREAVRTCVLAKRWRTLWKSVPAIRVCDPETYDSATGSSTFVDELLRLRDPTSMNVCIIDSHYSHYYEMADSDSDDESFERMEPWLQYAVSNRVQELTVRFPLRVTNMTLISSHLKRLYFAYMRFGRSLDFSSCQVLEVLTMIFCNISADISSQSLKHLSILVSDFDSVTRTVIFAPNLVVFHLDLSGGLSPLLNSVPSLVTAYVSYGDKCADFCGCGNQSCDGCPGESSDIDCSVVLNALSSATNLRLTISNPSVFIFRKDLKWRPMFRKLKNLVLRDWCMLNNFTGLVYFLRHSPILEALTIERCHEEELVIDSDESCYKPREHLLLSKHLKIVKLLCQTREDGEIPRILKVLVAHGVPSERIVIRYMDELLKEVLKEINIE